MRKISKLLFIAILTGVFTANLFAQCGLPGTPPCPPTKTPAPTKKSASKPAPKPPVSKSSIPAIRKSQKRISRPESQAKFIPHAPEIEMVQIPAGSFMMGGGRYDDEKPIHKVNISRNFWMGKYEVTQSQWQTVVGSNPSLYPNCDDCPVEYITWDNAQAFIRDLNNLQSEYEYRLPTEAEWEYAARAGTTGDYYENLDSIGWHISNSGRERHPVGQKQPNAFGLYDMSGNVSEWCQDWYENYTSATETDPTGAVSSSFRLSRGGGWKDYDTMLRSASRSGNLPSFKAGSLGFRLVRTAL